MNAVETVTKLIALAGSSNEHEATEAAKEACRRIRQHDLRVVAGGAAVGDVPADAPASPTWSAIMQGVGVRLQRAPEMLEHAAEIAKGVTKLRDIWQGKRNGG